MKKVLVFGAGRVSGPAVQYLLGKGHRVTVMDPVKANAERVIRGHPFGKAVVGDALRDGPGMIEADRPDIIVSLLPVALAVPAIDLSLQFGISQVCPIYLNTARHLEKAVREAGVTVLGEVGLDPGIDHISATRTIRGIHAAGGQVESFWSVCGSLPDYAANTNPLGYKLTWAPESLVGASVRDATLVKDGKPIIYPGGETFRHYSLEEIAGLGWFEVYANADSTPYIEQYGMPEVKNVFRGTLRFTGWCDFIMATRALGLYGQEKRDLSGQTFAGLVRKIVGASAAAPAAEAAAEFLELPVHCLVLKQMGWLGLFDERPLPFPEGSLRDVLTFLFYEKLLLSPGEKDLVVMQHRYGVRYPETGRRVVLASTLVDRGGAGEETSIARTTGTPFGIGADLILQGRVPEKGLIGPTVPSINDPMLEELERMGIRFTETERELERGE